MKKFLYFGVLVAIVSATQLYMSWSTDPWTWVETFMVLYPLIVGGVVFLFQWAWKKIRTPRNRFHMV